jgi:hypothetical protein
MLVPWVPSIGRSAAAGVSKVTREIEPSGRPKMKSPRRKSEIDQIAEKARALDQEGCAQILLVTNAARPHQGKKRAVHPSEPAAVRSTLSVPEPDPAVSAVPTQCIVVAKYQNPAHMLHAAAVHAEPLRITQRNTSAQVATVQRRPRLGYIDPTFPK